MKKAQTFYADVELIDFLSDFKRIYKIPKSEVLNALLKHFSKNKEALLEIIKEV